MLVSTPVWADGDCCFQCGAIPCPYDHEEARQTRLKDLEFIKDLAKERREMKETIARVGIKMMKRIIG